METPEIQIRHREVGRGYTLNIAGVQETIIMNAERLLTIAGWCSIHKEELEKELLEESEQSR